MSDSKAFFAAVMGIVASGTAAIGYLNYWHRYEQVPARVVAVACERPGASPRRPESIACPPQTAGARTVEMDVTVRYVSPADHQVRIGRYTERGPSNRAPAAGAAITVLASTRYPDRILPLGIGDE